MKGILICHSNGENCNILLNSNIEENESHVTVLNSNMSFNNVEYSSECLINNDICEYNDSINPIISHIEDYLYTSLKEVRLKNQKAL